MLQTIHFKMTGRMGYTCTVVLLCVCVIEVYSVNSENTARRLLKYVDERISTERNDRKEEYSGLSTKIKDLNDLFKTLLEQNLIATKELSIKMESFENAMKLTKTSTEEHFKTITNKMIKRLRVEFSIKMEKLQKHVEDSIQDLKPLVNHTQETVKSMSVNVIRIKENLEKQVDNINVKWENFTERHFHENKDTCRSFAHDLTMKIENLKTFTTKSSQKYKSSSDLFKHGFRSNGIFVLEIDRSENDKIVIPVYCDMTTDGGGWTAFQRRKDGSVDFNRDWSGYKFGFGKLDGDFWLGNEYINVLNDDSETHELRVDLEDYQGNRAYAKYSKFKVGPERTNYTLEVGDYTGNAGDSLDKTYRSHVSANGMQFSTKDKDNDNKQSVNCASRQSGGWWFNSCFDAFLNGVYHTQPDCQSYYNNCIIWREWKGLYGNLKFTEMKLR